MKVKTLIILIFLGMLAIPVLQAQDAAKPGNDPALQQTQVPVAGAFDDSRLSPQQSGMQKQAGEVNPSHPKVSAADPRLAGKEIPEEKFYGESNSKPPSGTDAAIAKEMESRDILKKQQEKEEQNRIAAQSSLPASNQQPVGIQPKTVTNFRNLNGTNEQPEPVKNARVTNYRELNGPNDQPKGIEPKK